MKVCNKVFGVFFYSFVRVSSLAPQFRLSEMRQITRRASISHRTEVERWDNMNNAQILPHGPTGSTVKLECKYDIRLMI